MKITFFQPYSEYLGSPGVKDKKSCAMYTKQGADGLFVSCWDSTGREISLLHVVTCNTVCCGGFVLLSAVLLSAASPTTPGYSSLHPQKSHLPHQT